MAPSLKAFRKFGFPEEQSKEIRNEIQNYERRFPLKRPVPRYTMDAINRIMNSNGVEYIPPGNNSRSPGIMYINEGHTYTTTVLFVNGRFRLGCWGDIVERGNYD